MNAQQNAFFKSIVPAAQAAQRKWCVPVSVTIAQAILESGWGQSALARKAYNFFGIKAAAHAAPDGYAEFPTKEFVDGRRVSEMARFARYASPAEGFAAHAVLLATTVRYKPAMAVAADPYKFCVQIQKCGYSTNPAYAEELWTLIERFDLTQYDIKPDGPAAAAQEVAA
ncbi:MAG: glucosaminidase domain-containing protein [Terracidiphilus sp.]|nr:glucosaminidase domain-containing protein [Terracidiphilus sp.]